MKSHQIARLALLVMIALALIVPNIAVSAHVTPPPPITKVHVHEETTPATDEPVYPTCQFGPLNPVGPAPLTVHFDASSSKEAVGYSWYTADGPSTGGQITWDHTFLNEGTYKVRLTVWSPEGFNYSCSTWVTVLASTSELTPVVTTVPVVTPTLPVVTGPSIESNHDGCDDQVSKVENSGTVIVICKNEGDIIINPPPDEETKEAELNFLQKIGLYLANLMKAFFGLK